MSLSDVSLVSHSLNADGARGYDNCHSNPPPLATGWYVRFVEKYFAMMWDAHADTGQHESNDKEKDFSTKMYKSRLRPGSKPNKSPSPDINGVAIAFASHQ